MYARRPEVLRCASRGTRSGSRRSRLRCLPYAAPMPCPVLTCWLLSGTEPFFFSFFLRAVRCSLLLDGVGCCVVSGTEMACGGPGLEQARLPQRGTAMPYAAMRCPLAAYRTLLCAVCYRHSRECCYAMSGTIIPHAACSPLALSAILCRACLPLSGADTEHPFFPFLFSFFWFQSGANAAVDVGGAGGRVRPHGPGQRCQLGKRRTWVRV